MKVRIGIDVGRHLLITVATSTMIRTKLSAQLKHLPHTPLKRVSQQYCAGASWCYGQRSSKPEDVVFIAHWYYPKQQMPTA